MQQRWFLDAPGIEWPRNEDRRLLGMVTRRQNGIRFAAIGLCGTQTHNLSSRMDVVVVFRWSNERQRAHVANREYSLCRAMEVLAYGRRPIGATAKSIPMETHTLAIPTRSAYCRSAFRRSAGVRPDTAAKWQCTSQISICALCAYAKSFRCAHTFSNALTYCSTNSGASCRNKPTLIAREFTSSQPGNAFGTRGEWCHHCGSE
jgi:hypothetical protein